MTPRESLPTLLLVLDLCGTFAFALSGAMAGIRRHLDIFGVAIAGGLVCLGLRVMAIRRGWQLPVARASDAPDHGRPLT